MVRWLAAFIYFAAAVAFVLIADANAENDTEASLVLGTASLAVGVLSGWWPAVLFPLVLTPIAVPFDYPNAYDPRVHGEPLPTFFFAMIWTIGSAALIILAAAVAAVARKAWGRDSGRTRPT